jgi:hypothetical protein
VVAGVLLISVIASIIWPRKQEIVPVPSELPDEGKGPTQANQDKV